MREPRVSVSRSIFALVDDRDRTYFGRGREEADQVGLIDEKTRAIFGRSWHAARAASVAHRAGSQEKMKRSPGWRQIRLLLTVPNQLGVAYNAHVIEAESLTQCRRSRFGVALTKHS